MANTQISNKKLKAIVFTDIVDFTKLSAEDEQHALNIIDKQREIVKPIVEKHNGEWLKEIGDGLLFSFDSSLDAVRCSIDIQETLKNSDDFKLRIGIHQGDIFIKDGDVYGDDVNIASRVEGFSPEGGISISDKVYKDIQGVRDIQTSFIGHKPLKGVSQETKIRCIVSNNLPKDNSNSFPEIIGYTNMYFGTLLILMYSILGMMSLSTGSKMTTISDASSILNFVIFTFISLGINLILFGYSTISFYKGVSIKSQKFIYYISIVYALGMLIYFYENLAFLEIETDEFSSDWNPFIGKIVSFIANLFLFILPLLIYKSIQFIYKKITN